MRALILGGTSLTGPYVVRRLHETGHEVTVFHRGEHEVDSPPDIRHIHGDFAKPPRELLNIESDVVIHMWAMSEEDAECFLERFKSRAGRAVVISSGDVYRAYGCLKRKESGRPHRGPLSEGAPLRESRYPYKDLAPSPTHWMATYDKVLVEEVLMRQSDLPVTILRYPAVLGPGEARRFTRWLGPMLKGEPELLIQDDWASWRWTHGLSEDVAEAVVVAATDPVGAGRIYNVGEPETPTMFERLTAFARVAGWGGRLLRVPQSVLPEVDRMSLDFAHHLVYDTTRIRTELGYREVVPHDEASRRTLELERTSES